MPAAVPQRLLVLSVLLSTCFAVRAGPYETGSTSTAKGLKFKTNVQLKHSADKDSWVLPKLGVGGPLAENLELSVGSGYGMIRRTDGGRSGGLRDLSAGLKWRLLDEHGSRPAVTIEPSLGMPTGDRRSGIGKGAYSLELPVRAGHQFGDFRLTGQVSVQRSFGRDEDQFGSGVLLEYFPSPRWSCGIELVADAPLDEPAARHLRANLGAKQKIGQHLQWQALAGRTLENRRGGPVTTIKLALEYLL
jgi:hypothetical protein